MKISLDEVGLKRVLGAGQNITLVRRATVEVGPNMRPSSSGPNTGLLANHPYDVAWQAFQPLRANFVSWNDIFYAFVTTIRPQPGRLLAMNATLEISLGCQCRFKDGDLAATEGSLSGAIGIVNAASGDPVAFGLAQRADINGTPVLRPLCVATVLGGQTALFTPHDEAAIFPSDVGHGGIVIPPLGEFIGFKRGVAVAFDDNANAFRPDP